MFAKKYMTKEFSKLIEDAGFKTINDDFDRTFDVWRFTGSLNGWAGRCEYSINGSSFSVRVQDKTFDKMVDKLCEKLKESLKQNATSLERN